MVSGDYEDKSRRVRNNSRSARWVLFAVAGDAGSATIPLMRLASAAYIACFFGSLATTVKRLHDRGRSGWLMLIGLIPLVGIWLMIEVGFISGEPHKNHYCRPVA